MQNVDKSHPSGGIKAVATNGHHVFGHRYTKQNRRRCLPKLQGLWRFQEEKCAGHSEGIPHAACLLLESLVTTVVKQQIVPNISPSEATCKPPLLLLLHNAAEYLWAALLQHDEAGKLVQFYISVINRFSYACCTSSRNLTPSSLR